MRFNFLNLHNIQPIYRILRIFAYIVSVFLLFLTVLTLIYRLPFTHPVSTLMLRDSIMLTSYKREWVSLDDISPHLVNSVIAAEDSQFCRHSGIDWPALRYAIFMDDEEIQLGASTISMQLVKNLYLWGSRSYLRKAIEIPLTLWVDLLLPKKRIIEIYLNIAQWGDGIYGIEAAAQTYFGRSAKNLTARQSAWLTVSLPSPLTRKPNKLPLKEIAHALTIEQRAKAISPYTACLR